MLTNIYADLEEFDSFLYLLLQSLTLDGFNLSLREPVASLGAALTTHADLKTKLARNAAVSILCNVHNRVNQVVLGPRLLLGRLEGERVVLLICRLIIVWIRRAKA